MIDMTLARIRELNKNRTPGEWRWTGGGTGLENIDHRGWCSYDVMDIWHSGGCGCRAACDLEVTISEADAKFIAEAPGMVDYLLGIVDEVRELHQPDGDLRLCRTCGAAGGTWPCDTIRANSTGGWATERDLARKNPYTIKETL